MKRSPELLRGMAEWAERKANEASASDKPWWKGNLRTYQNMASKFWSEYYQALKVEASK